MSDGTIGVLLLLSVTVVAAVLLHRSVRNFWLASVTAAAIGSGVLHLAAYLRLGYSDPFDVVSIPFSFVIGLGISAFVGIAVRSLRRKADRRDSVG
jgi:hypothetical protein